MVVSQFCTDDSVNSLLKYSKCVVDNLCSSYERPKQLKQVQYLIFAGMISYYGFDHLDEITRTFKSTKFTWAGESSSDEFWEKKGANEYSRKICSDDDVCASFFRNFFYNKNSKIYTCTGEVVMFDDANTSPDNLLEYTIHEVNHALNGLKRALTPKDGVFVSRIGLYRFDLSNGDRKGRYLEETINTLQAAEIMEHILEFTNYKIKDPEIKYYLDSMRYAANKRRMGLGYDDSLDIIRPLYENERYKIVTNNSRLSGFLDGSIQELERKAGFNSFDRLCESVDGIYLDPKHAFKNAHEAKGIVKQYCK